MELIHLREIVASSGAERKLGAERGCFWVSGRCFPAHIFLPGADLWLYIWPSIWLCESVTPETKAVSLYKSFAPRREGKEGCKITVKMPQKDVHVNDIITSHR